MKQAREVLYIVMHSDQQLVHDALRERILTGNERIKVDALKKVKV